MTYEEATVYAGMADQLAKLEAVILATEALPRSELFETSYVIAYPQLDGTPLYLKEDPEGDRFVKALVHATWYGKREGRQKEDPTTDAICMPMRVEWKTNLIAMKDTKATLLSVALETAD